MVTAWLHYIHFYQEDLSQFSERSVGLFNSLRYDNSHTFRVSFNVRSRRVVMPIYNNNGNKCYRTINMLPRTTKGSVHLMSRVPDGWGQINLVHVMTTGWLQVAASTLVINVVRWLSQLVTTRCNLPYK